MSIDSEQRLVFERVASEELELVEEGDFEVWVQGLDTDKECANDLLCTMNTISSFNEISFFDETMYYVSPGALCLCLCTISSFDESICNTSPNSVGTPK